LNWNSPSLEFLLCEKWALHRFRVTIHLLFSTCNLLVGCHIEEEIRKLGCWIFRTMRSRVAHDHKNRLIRVLPFWISEKFYWSIRYDIRKIIFGVFEAMLYLVEVVNVSKFWGQNFGNSNSLLGLDEKIKKVSMKRNSSWMQGFYPYSLKRFRFTNRNCGSYLKIDFIFTKLWSAIFKFIVKKNFLVKKKARPLETSWSIFKQKMPQIFFLYQNLSQTEM